MHPTADQDQAAHQLRMSGRDSGGGDRSQLASILGTLLASYGDSPPSPASGR